MLSLACKNRAFSLLEVIIAIAILSTGFIAILQAFSFSMRSARLSCDIIKAVFLAEDNMQELEFKEKQKILNDEPVQAEGQKGKFSWQYNLALRTDINLYRLDFDITWQSLNKEEAINLNTYLSP